MPLKDVYPKECVATPLRTPYPPPPLAPRVGPLKGLFEKVPLQQQFRLDWILFMIIWDFSINYLILRIIVESFTSVCPSCAQASCASLMF